MQQIAEVSKALQELQKRLLGLLSELDDLRKINDYAEEQEVLAVYMAYRLIH